MMAGLTPLVEGLLEATTGPQGMDNPEDILMGRDGSVVAETWEYLIGLQVGGAWKKSSLLQTHSTFCLQHQKFPTTEWKARWDFSCAEIGCSGPGPAISDDEAPTASSEEHGESWSWGSGYQIYLLLTGLGVPIGLMISHFFDESFPHRCGFTLFNEMENLYWEWPQDEPVNAPTFRFFLYVTTFGNAIVADCWHYIYILAPTLLSTFSGIRIPLNDCWIKSGNASSCMTVVDSLTR